MINILIQYRQDKAKAYYRRYNMKNEIKEVLMKRDGYNKYEAETELNMMREEFYSIVDNGGNLEDVEELLYSEGLELDYIFDLF